MSSLLVRSRLRWDSIPKPGEYQLDRWFHHPTVCRKQTKKSLSLKEFFLCPSLLLKLFKYKKNYNKTQKLKDSFLFYFFNFDDYWFDCVYLWNVQWAAVGLTNSLTSCCEPISHSATPASSYIWHHTHIVLCHSLTQQCFSRETIFMLLFDTSWPRRDILFSKTLQHYTVQQMAP